MLKRTPSILASTSVLILEEGLTLPASVVLALTHDKLTPADAETFELVIIATGHTVFNAKNK
jgi:hypothetical protein